MLSFRFLRIFVVCSTLCVYLNTQANGGQCGLGLDRDHAYDGVTSVNMKYILTTLQGTDFPTCVQNCLLHSRECAALLYSKTLLSCKLLKCHLNDKLVLSSAEGVEWEYWKNNDACEEGWTTFAGHCYFFNERKSTWDYAEDFCSDQDSYLVEMNSLDENSWITESFLLPETAEKEQCPNFWSCSVWIGATLDASSSTFVLSHSGGEMVIPEWAVGQPNNHSGNKLCVVIMRSGTANDKKCDQMFQFICEKE